MVVEWLCPGLRPTRSNRPRLLHCKVILLDEHELLQDVLVSSTVSRYSHSRGRLPPDRHSVGQSAVLLSRFHRFSNRGTFNR